jgi:hypothetical protein
MHAVHRAALRSGVIASGRAACNNTLLGAPLHTRTSRAWRGQQARLQALRGASIPAGSAEQRNDRGQQGPRPRSWDRAAAPGPNRGTGAVQSLRAAPAPSKQPPQLYRVQTTSGWGRQVWPAGQPGSHTSRHQAGSSAKRNLLAQSAAAGRGPCTSLPPRKLGPQPQSKHRAICTLDELGRAPGLSHPRSGSIQMQSCAHPSPLAQCGHAPACGRGGAPRALLALTPHEPGCSLTCGPAPACATTCPACPARPHRPPPAPRRPPPQPRRA